MVNIDCSSERSSGELAGGDGGEDLADRVNRVLADVHGSEEVVDGVESQAIKHPRKEHICEMNDSKQNTELKNLTEEKLSKVPVILLQSEDKGLHRYSPPVNILIVLSDFLQAKTCHPSSLQGLPQPSGDQEDDSLEDEEDIHPLVEGSVWWRTLARGA